MNQSLRLAIFFLVFFSPWASTAYVISSDLKNAGYASFPLIGAVIFIGFLLTIFGTFALLTIVDPSTRPRLVRAGLANLIFVLLDIGIFMLLVYGRKYSNHKCDLGPKCETYPVIWLTLASLHFNYFAMGCLIKLKTRWGVNF